MRDLRDPSLLGNVIFMGVAQFRGRQDNRNVSTIVDRLNLNVRNYQDETTIEKYGDPRKLPSTLPN